MSQSLNKITIGNFLLAPTIFDDPSLLAYVHHTDERTFAYIQGKPHTAYNYVYLENFATKLLSITPSYLGRFAVSLGMTNTIEYFMVSI